MQAQTTIASAPSFVPSVSPTQPALPRRRLAQNVIAMHAEDRPPVVQTRSRRGRYPACVVLFGYGRPPFYVGALCALRTQMNDDVPVRLVALLENGQWHVETIGPRQIVCSDGAASRSASVNRQALVRTATVGACHDR